MGPDSHQKSRLTLCLAGKYSVDKRHARTLNVVRDEVLLLHNLCKRDDGGEVRNKMSVSDFAFTRYISTRARSGACG